MTFRVDLPDEVVDEIARRAAAIVLDGLDRTDSSPWMTTAQTAAYLGLDTPARLYKKLATIPHHRWDGRIFFDRRELDSWLGGMR